VVQSAGTKTTRIEDAATRREFENMLARLAKRLTKITPKRGASAVAACRWLYENDKDNAPLWGKAKCTLLPKDIPEPQHKHSGEDHRFRSVPAAHSISRGI